jgi:O-antigen ligase
MTVSLAIAVFMEGGVKPGQWEWCALGLAIAACLAVSSVSKRELQFRKATAGLSAMALLLGWMVFQIVPLPPAFIARLSPAHWNAIAAARALTGEDAGQWAALSLATPATIQRLLDVAPAMAAFIAAREMGCWWSNRLWIAVAPVVGVAWLESLVGIVQFYFMRVAGGSAGAARGTYVDPDHFAGLLEMAFPVAVFWSIVIWRQFSRSKTQWAGPAFWTAFLLAVSGCLLIGIIVSLSRMGFISTLIAMGFAILLLVASFAYGNGGTRRVRKWLIPLALAIPLLIAVFLPTRELILRFADLTATDAMSKDTRLAIWRDTRKVIRTYPWTGTGLGAYERGLYAEKTAAPMNTVDFAHSDYLQVLTELGVVGATLALVVAVWTGWRLLSVVMKGESSNWTWAVGLLGALLAIGVHSLADFNLYIPANALAFAWLGGVAVSPGLNTGFNKG